MSLVRTELPVSNPEEIGRAPEKTAAGRKSTIFAIPASSYNLKGAAHHAAEAL
jgi:hypothetical protein